MNAKLFMEALNVFNHPNFFVGDQGINSPQFGQDHLDGGVSRRGRFSWG